MIFQSCTIRRPDTNPLLDKKAKNLATQTKSLNQHILTSKGTGWARVESKTKVDNFRIAWAAVFPDKIRITFLMSANPIETIIATGEKITFISHTGEHSRYSNNSKDPDMGKYIDVPIKMSEMILILLGRLPVRNFNDTYFSPSDPSLFTIATKQKGAGATQYFHLNEKKVTDTLWVEDFNRQLVYKSIIKEYKTFDKDTIPGKLEIKDNNSRKVTLEITNFISNPKIKESLFLLTD